MRQEKTPQKTNEYMFQIIVLGAGALMMILALCLKNERAFACLSGIAASTMAAAGVAIGMQWVFQRRDTQLELYRKWGFQEIHRDRQHANLSVDQYQDRVKKQIDIIAFGLSSWRQSRGAQIQDALQRNIAIRILVPDPESAFLEQVDYAEDKQPGSTKSSILSLLNWAEEYQHYPNLQIKLYTALPLDLYFRVDDHLMVGPAIFGKASQQSITYEFEKSGEGFAYFTQYFEDLWNGKTYPPLPTKDWRS